MALVGFGTVTLAGMLLAYRARGVQRAVVLLMWAVAGFFAMGGTV
jgi:hypothetical protein